jgi:putative transposase
MDKALWARFGEAALKASHAIQWLADNGPPYTATASMLYAHELGLVPITTPAYSPEGNGLRPPAEYRATLELMPPSV